MSVSSYWAFPSSLQPRPEQVPFDLESAVQSIVTLHSEIPDNALTARLINTERNGSGVVIEDTGLILTVSWLITEARSVWLTTHDGKVMQGDVVAYDSDYGFGLVMPLGRLDLPPLRRGNSTSLRRGDNVVILGAGGLPHSLNAHVTARREFAGWWEYVLDDAIFTAPAHPQLGGTALLGCDGRLLGVGSQLVEDSIGGRRFDTNMFVPVERLDPILDDLMRFGRPSGPARPWLGIYVTERDGDMVIGGLSPDGPAHRGGVHLGDRVTQVAGEDVRGLANLFRRIWAVGPAGTQIPLTLVRNGRTLHVTLRSSDRGGAYIKPLRH